MSIQWNSEGKEFMSWWRFCVNFLVFMSALFFQPSAQAASVDFERDIKPIFAASCLKCHGAEKQQGGLRLDLKSAALKGGDSGEAAIVAGSAAKSSLFERINSQDETVRMPADGEPLTKTQIELLKRWIDDGAAWPESNATSPAPLAKELFVTDADREHWAFRPLQDVALPEVKDQAWVRTPVDRFIRHAQEAKGLAPTLPAEPRVLLRRFYFDFLGLPPVLNVENGKITEDRLGLAIDGSTFNRDSNSVVDALLNSPHYGERWARHWLDLARYADSDGQESDADRPNAYRYRDFVIRALNEDLPYDRFVWWQIAGDELAPDNPQAIAATGFLVAGTSAMLDVPMEEEKLRERANELDDMISTTCQALLGMTIACARCHDHKYDPLPTRDYYRMLRVFNGGDRNDVPFASPAAVRDHEAKMAAWRKEYDAAVKQRDDWLKKAREPILGKARAKKIAKLPISDDEKKRLKDQPNDPAAKKLAERFKNDLKISDANALAELPKKERAKWEELDKAANAIATREPGDLPMAFGFADFGPEPRETWFFERGDFLARNERMELGFLTVLTKGKSAAEYWESAKADQRQTSSTQQRRAMAIWITDRDNGAGALLARVMANRIWQQHFGEGLVRTPSDFGTRGERPTHPELLEWLAGELVRSGWSIKHLHRLIATSATYQQGTAADKAKTAIDPENRLLWHRRPRRLEAEVLRDAMLAASGSLNLEQFGPSVKPPIAVEAMQARNVKDPYPKDLKDTPETRRRSIYLFHKRVVQYPLLQAFDAPDAQVSCGRRLNTTVAPQALALLNDPFVRLRAGELAKRVQKEGGADVTDQLRRVFQLCLSREPLPEELDEAKTFLSAQAAARQQRDAKQSHEATARLALTDFCQVLFGLNEFVYVD